MVKAHNSWPQSIHSTWQPPDLSCMNATTETGQQVPAHINSGHEIFTPNVDFPGFAVPGDPIPKTDHVNELAAMLQLPPQFEPSILVPNLQVEETQPGYSCGLRMKAVPNAVPLSFPKRFFIFDWCQNQSRLVYNSSFPPVKNSFTATTKLEGVPALLNEEDAAKVYQFDPSKPSLQGESDFNRIYAEGSEMHEDTEEINALLYSEDDDDGCSSDDEIRSTGHSPFPKWSPEKQEYLEEVTEEFEISDHPNKRQKLVNGGYKSALIDTASSMHLNEKHDLDNSVESSYILGTEGREKIGSILGNDQPRKDKIRGTLKILESMIPNGKGKDPLIVLDEAISYLKSMKIKAKALGVHYY